ncbi:hypothetical protein BT63DRAFT_458313 [Microthyrium microscopicum]|uniref:Uncharacterized protein n=1 Tax=Microthyrium microscopicum TaxID=703497 RepID=A0A6A6U491_9PEZI|nr:hypothetical protein BT63DRAFT_458313 [Microthyrium microscopicum]
MCDHETQYRYAKHGFAGLDKSDAREVRLVMASECEKDKEYARRIEALIRRFAAERKSNAIARAAGKTVHPPWIWKRHSYGRDGRTRVEDSPVPEGPIDHSHHDPVLTDMARTRYDKDVAEYKLLRGRSEHLSPSKSNEKISLPADETSPLAKGPAMEAPDDSRWMEEIFFKNGKRCNFGQKERSLFEPYMKARVSKDLFIPAYRITHESFLVWEKKGFDKPRCKGWLKKQQRRERAELKVRLERPECTETQLRIERLEIASRQRQMQAFRDGDPSYQRKLKRRSAQRKERKLNRQTAQSHKQRQKSKQIGHDGGKENGGELF